ncbi:glycosyltransferase [Nocardioides mangrovicus]|uniref:Glycosyltransferase n=2 Tax=Nocardioides mangrovicus TaxID=2478913 RepID=A0A3L8P612_9ACTN|nr:glycosyltransferase [Nocardioides mangrovicus]
MVTRLARAVAAGSVVPDELLVVDNASTDDTVAALRELGVRVHEMGRNAGGAGGFAAGLEAFLDSDADLVWLMDDDGVPAPDCLELLLPYVDRYDFVGPAVVSDSDPEQLCFPIRLPGGSRTVRRLADVEAAAHGSHDGGLVEDVVIPFNGVLVTRALVERIGVVREELFIWGDDVEYLWRARRAGARIATVVAARFAHPATDDLGTPEMFGLTTYNHSPSDLKHYCMCRNNVANLREYAGPLGVLAFVVKTVWFYLLTKPDLGRLRMSLGAMHDGFYGRWGRHERYLP